MVQSSCKRAPQCRLAPQLHRQHLPSKTYFRCALHAKVSQHLLQIHLLVLFHPPMLCCLSHVPLHAAHVPSVWIKRPVEWSPVATQAATRSEQAVWSEQEGNPQFRGCACCQVRTHRLCSGAAAAAAAAEPRPWRELVTSSSSRGRAAGRAAAPEWVARAAQRTCSCTAGGNARA